MKIDTLRRSIVACAVFAGVTVSATGVLGQATTAPTSGDAVNLAEETTNAGRELFHGAGSCYACHGSWLQGGPVAPPLTGPTWETGDGSFEFFLHTIRGGVPKTSMTAHPGGLDDAQVIQIASYVYAVTQGKTQAVAAGTPPPADAAEEVVDAGRKVFHGRGTCNACHGSKLQGGPIAPPLIGPTWKTGDGTFEFFLHIVRGGVPGTIMVAHPGGISDGEAIQVANYIFAVSHGKTQP